MPTFLLFNTEAEAIAAEAKASENVRRFVRLTAPERIAPDGSIYGINSATWQIQPAAARAEGWAIPEHVAEGWVMPLPLTAEIAPVPLSTFLLGVGGQQVEIPPLEPSS